MPHLLRSLLFMALLPTLAFAQAPKVKLGVDVLRESNFAALANKRIGLIVNPASVAGDLTPTVDVLRAAPNVQLVALFGPEHGVYGDVYAGDKVPDMVDPRTGIPIFSLYGKTKKPTPEMLKGIDALVFDLQDLGARSYTYVSTLRDVIAGCAENNVELIILDRPNPLGGNRIEGGPVAPGFESHVSYIPTPYLHGMTMGELAMLLRDTYSPTFQKLTVVKMAGWKRDMTWNDTGLQWVPTSPHIPSADTVPAYVATGILGELGVLSNGVGYTLPFQIVGAPFLSADALADALNTHYASPAHAYAKSPATRPTDVPTSPAFPDPGPSKPAGLYFQPIRFRPFYATFEKTPCQGVQLRIDPKTPENLTEINFRLLQTLNAPHLLALAPKRHNMFDKVTGSPQARELLQQNADLTPLFNQWRTYSESFRTSRQKYLLY